VNRLGRESSPYLKQHADNPVDWYPWGEDAFSRARAEDRPILLSVGYSACHWCHVMAHESFEDAETAALMNRLFVNVKVDREERPDVDHIYQTAVQLLRQSGGWPLTCFLTPDGKPFFAGTYFPNEPRHGMPAFREVLTRIDAVYREQRGDVDKQAESLADALQRVHQRGGGEGIPDRETFEAGAEFLLGRMDPEHGGFAGAPKFPSPTNLWTLWRQWRRGRDTRFRDAVLLTLRKMAAGGIYDQLGGGFHRYSTDAEWLAPHFEKMLYDNGQLVGLYVEAWRECANGDGPRELAQELLRIATETLDYLVRDMRSPEGLFYAATDADSEGEEGRYFVWSPRGVAAVLQDPVLSDTFCRFYDVTAEGNWEGHSILRRLRPAGDVAADLGISEAELWLRLDRARAPLLAARGERVPPLRDDKLLVSWNGYAILAFVEGWRATGRADWLQVAIQAASAVLDRLVDDGRLQHSLCGTDRRGPAFLDDHAAFGTALLHVYEASGERRFLDAAQAIAIALDGWFADRVAGGWFMTPEDGEQLIHRPKDTHDSAVPSGSALAASFLQRLHVHTGEERWLGLVEGTLRAHSEQMESNPYGAGHLLGVLDAWLGGFEEIVLGGAGKETLARVTGEVPGLDRVVLALDALPAGHAAAGGRSAEVAMAWVCRGHTCSLPVTSGEALRAVLERR
jgi:uncharacterized protein YyaL (SSP411 family)